jgi:hypothetical protein
LKGVVGSCDAVENDAMGDYFKIMLRVTQLPPELQQVLRVGGCSQSDWKTREEIIRA